MVHRQHLYRVFGACLFLVFLAACSAAAPAALTPTAGAVLPSERRPVTLFLWHAWPGTEQRTLLTLVERYNRTHPQTQIVPQARPLASLTRDLRAAMLEGNGPHLVILQSHTLGGLVQSGTLLPLDDLVSAAERERLLPAAVGGAQVTRADGGTSLYGMPLTFDTLVLYYNKLNVAVPPADTNALLRIARGLTDARTKPPVWGLALNLSLDNTIGYLYAFDGRIFDAQGNLVLGSSGRAGTERWLQWLSVLRNDPQILAVPDGISVDNAIMAQEALMTIDWSHAMSGYRALWAENMGVAVLPRLSDANQPPSPYVQSDVIGISTRVVDSGEQSAAVDFIRYLLSEEAQAQFLAGGRQPVLRDLKLDSAVPEQEVARVVRAQGEQGQPMPNNQQMNEVVWEVLQLMQQNVLRGLTPPADAISNADAVLRARLGQPQGQ